MPVFDFDGVSLAYDVDGPDVGAPVVLLHGLSSARSTWHDLSAALASDWRVFSLDQRGHGESAKISGTYVLTSSAR